MTLLVKERLRALRKEKDETQVQVAKVIEIAVQHYQRLERGASVPSVETAWKLADHFDVSIDYLLGRRDER